MELYKKLRKMQILLIDDDEWIRDAMQLFFESEGCPIKTLETAEEGLKELTRNPYDIIIADYRLPGTDGLKFLKMTSSMYPKALKILITAYGNEQMVSEARQIGIQDFIEKPFTTRTLEASLSKLLTFRGDRTVYEVTVDEEKCTGCGECVDICPEGVYELQNETSIPVRSEDCEGCESCIEVCEQEAIIIGEV